MSMDALREIIKKHLFIIFSEKFNADNSGGFVERYVGKHPLLRPEFIVVNDQVHGFKKASKKMATLEEFPIYLELEGIQNEKDSCYVDCIDLYAEASVNCQSRLNDIIFLSKVYENHVRLERVMDVSNYSQESLIITSKIQEHILDLSGDESEEHYIELKEFKEIFALHLKIFVHVIKVLDDIIVKDISLSKVEKDTGYFPKAISK